MAKNTGKAYEEFVRDIQQSLINAEQMSHLKNITVELNKKIKDRNGVIREFDVYWEFILGGHIYQSVIECKDYASTINIEKIDAFIGKTADIPGLRLIYATKTGYQSGALKKAEQHKIDLLIVREAENEDWADNDGTPFIKTIDFNIVVISPPKITLFTPIIDGDWLKSQPDLDIEVIHKCFRKALNNTIFIFNEVSGERVSLLELGNSLAEIDPSIQYGHGTHTSQELHDSYLEFESSTLKFKLKGYKLEYEYQEPISMTSVIDYSKNLLGIVQNYISGNKQMVFKDQIVK